ncbi:MAG: sugar transferase [Thermomicrobiales bacterium]
MPIAHTNPIYARVKRATDVLLSATALIVLAPIFLVIALAILITSGCPVIYRQTRLWPRRPPFTLYKFLQHGAEFRPQSLHAAPPSRTQRPQRPHLQA